MKQLYSVFFTIFLLQLHLVTFSQRAVVSRVKVFGSRSELAKIRAAGIDFDHGIFNHEEGSMINDFEFSQVLEIRKLGFKVDVLVKDVYAYNDSINRIEGFYKYSNAPVRSKAGGANQRLNFTTSTQSYENYIPTPTTFVPGSMGGFYNLAEYEAQIDNMVASYPGLVYKGVVGTSLQGRNIWYIKISDNASAIQEAGEGQMMYTGMHHSREGMSMMNLMFFMRYLLENYSKNGHIKQLVDSRELYFIPVSNIDGFNYNTTAANWTAGRRMRRKNMQETTTTAINADGSGGDGVDINRNYGTWWGAAYASDGATANAASSGTGSADAYRGSAAFSEIETQNFRDFVNSHNFKIALNYHCYGNWWIRAGGPDAANYPETVLPAADVAVFNTINALLTKYNCYVYGTPEQTVYPVNGYSDDWLMRDPSHSPIYAFSPEIGPNADGFWCPQAKIIPYAKELVYANLQAAYMVGSYADIADNSDIAVTATSGVFNFTVTRLGLTNGPITVTLIPANNIQSVGAPVVIPSIATFGGTYSGSIAYTLPAGIAAGTPVRYTWRIETGGITVDEGITKLFNPTVVFTDNMDAGVYTAKWTRSGTGAAWNYAAGQGMGGTASLTESPAGAYAASADHIITLAAPLNLGSASQAYLSYMIKYASETGMDRLQVEISTTGIAGTYTPIVTNQTIVENRALLAGVPSVTGNSNGWVREVINLSSYIGNTNVGLRFRFRSNATNITSYGTDGFNIDNMMVVKSNAIILPVTFEDITALRAGETVVVKWKAQADADFSYYEVQRSEDGETFEALDRLTNPNASAYTDHRPATGFNYYRIKAVDNNGTVRYSKTVLIVFESGTKISVYPNPVYDVLNIEIQSTRTGTAFAEVSTIDGRQVYKGAIALKEGSNLHKVQLGNTVSQAYIVKISDWAGSMLKTFKVIQNKK